MNSTDSTADRRDAQERTLALAALAASPAHAERIGPCPGDSAFAAFVDGVLDEAEQASVQRHVEQCPTCYPQWLEVAEALGTPVTSATHAVEPVVTRRWFERFVAPWPVAGPAMAFATMAAVAVVVVLSGPGRVDAPLEAQYAAAGTIASASIIALPWESAGLAFASAQPSDAQIAFGSGLWEGRRALLDKAQNTVLTAPEWADDDDTSPHHALGRWWLLALATAQLPRSPVERQQLERIGTRLAARLDTGPDADPSARLARRELAVVLPLVVRGGRPLARALSIGMSRLAPGGG